MYFPIPEHELEKIKLGMQPCRHCHDGKCEFNCSPAYLEHFHIVAAASRSIERIQKNKRLTDPVRSAEIRGVMAVLEQIRMIAGTDLRAMVHDELAWRATQEPENPDDQKDGPDEEIDNQMSPEEFKNARHALGMSARELADALGFRLNAVQRWEAPSHVKTARKPNRLAVREVRRMLAEKQAADEVKPAEDFGV